MRVMLEGHSALGGTGKDKKKDETLLRELLKAESESNSLQLADMKKLVECLRKAYFGHFCLLWNSSNFPSRQDTTKQYIYL